MLDRLPTSETHDRHRTLQLTRMKGGSRWIFDASNYQSWHKGASGTLWCNGGPGAGKTYLAYEFLDYLPDCAKPLIIFAALSSLMS